MTNEPQLSPDAQERFRAALLRSADLLLTQPKAAHILADFLDGRAVLLLTCDGMLVRPLQPEWLDDAARPAGQAAGTPRPDNNESTGVYL